MKNSDLDCRVAERVMGHKVVKARKLDLGWKNSSIPPYWLVANINPHDWMLADTLKDGSAKRVPRYSVEFEAAWAVVMKLSDRFHAVIRTPFVKGSKKFCCGFTPLGVTGWNGRPDFEAIEKTAPLAICKAALLAVKSGKHEVG